MKERERERKDERKGTKRNVSEARYAKVDKEKSAREGNGEVYRQGGKGGAHGYGEEVEGTKGLSAPCLPGINHVSVMLNQWPPARHDR